MRHILVIGLASLQQSPVQWFTYLCSLIGVGALDSGPESLVTMLSDSLLIMLSTYLFRLVSCDAGPCVFAEL